MIDRVIMRSHPPFSLSFSCVCLWGGVISRNNQGVAFFAANLQDITRLTKFLRWKMPCPIFTLENNSPMRVLPLLSWKDFILARYLRKSPSFSLFSPTLSLFSPTFLGKSPSNLDFCPRYCEDIMHFQCACEKGDTFQMDFYTILFSCCFRDKKDCSQGITVKIEEKCNSWKIIISIFCK